MAMAKTCLTMERLQMLCDRFPPANLAVLGDFFLDDYWILDKDLSEISIETGLEAYQVVGTRKSPGAAGTVTSILRSLDANVRAVSFCGDDGNGFELRRALTRLQVNLEHFYTFADRFTPTYMKPMLRKDGIETELSRMDTKNRQPLGSQKESQIIQGLRATLPHIHTVLITDQVQERNCGVVTDAVRTEVAQLAGHNPGTLFLVDSREHMHLFKNVILKFNITEAKRALNNTQPDDTPGLAFELGRQLFEQHHKPVIITRGEQGIQVTDQNGSILVPAFPVSGPTDIVGAGDSVMASMGTALSIAATLQDAAEIGVGTSSIIIQQIGTTGTASRQQVLQRFQEYSQFIHSQPDPAR